jgi:hypothetical protein
MDLEEEILERNYYYTRTDNLRGLSRHERSLFAFLYCLENDISVDKALRLFHVAPPLNDRGKHKKKKN